MSKRVRVKPGKSQSTVGFIGGLVFCFIGLFIAIPTFGIFGVFWTLIAVVITASSGYNAFSDKGFTSHEIIIDDDQNQSISSISRTPEERLSELQRLYEKGMITESEYQQKRSKILEEI